MDEAARAMVVVDVARMRAADYSWATCAQSLNGRGIPSPRGAQWWPDTVRRFADPAVAAKWASYMRTYRGRLP